MTEGTASGKGANPLAPQEEQPAEEREPRRGVLRTASAVMRRDGCALYGRAARVGALTALGGLLVTAVGFLVAWPLFAEILQGALNARRDEDSYAPDGMLVNHMWLIALAGLPFLVLMLHLGCATLQTASARAALGRGPGRPASGDGAGSRPGSGFRRVLGVYLLRGVCVWLPVVIGNLVAEYFTSTDFREYTAIVPKWQYPHLFPLLAYGVPLLGLVATLVLRFGWALAPATAAAEGLPVLAALRRSWSLVWGRVTALLRTLALALPLGALTLGVYVLLQFAARPLRHGVASLFVQWGPDNTYAAYVAGVLAPIAVATVLTGALVLPLAHTVLALLQQRLVRDRVRRAADTAAAQA